MVSLKLQSCLKVLVIFLNGNYIIFLHLIDDVMYFNLIETFDLIANEKFQFDFISECSTNFLIYFLLIII